MDQIDRCDCESFFKSNKYKYHYSRGLKKAFKKRNMEFISKNSYFYFVHSHRVKIIARYLNWNNKLWRKFYHVEKGNIF